MAAEPYSEEIIARYLLGDLTEEQQTEIEDRAFTDEGFLQDIMAVESDLIDEYVRHELGDSQRRQFETRFLASDERRRKVEFARALSTVASEAEGPEKDARPAVVRTPITWRDSLAAFVRVLSPAAKFAMAAAMLLIVFGGSWLLVQTYRSRSELARIRAEQQAETLAQELERAREQQTKPTILSLALLPGIPRSGSARPKLVLPKSARLVRLQVGIEPEDQYKNFRVELRGPRAQQVVTRDGLSARKSGAGRVVVLSFPAKMLDPGQYEL